MQEISLFSKNYSRGNTYRLELRCDLLGDWVVSRYYNHRRKMQVFSNYANALKAFSKAEAGCEKRGYIPLVKKTFDHDKNTATNTNQVAAKSISATEECFSNHKTNHKKLPKYLAQAVKAFMENTDWIDVTNCFEMSADEFADANWKRFKSWLGAYLQKKISDQEVFVFSIQIWGRYRETAAL